MQNEFGHITPDWKFHISVAHHDLRQAWNLVLGIFLKMKCTSGLKVIYLPEISQPQKGREITVYILKYADCYSRSQFAGDFGLSIA